MPNINYEISADLHKQLKMKAAEEGLTLKELITLYLTQGLQT